MAEKSGRKAVVVGEGQGAFVDHLAPRRVMDSILQEPAEQSQAKAKFPRNPPKPFNPTE